MKISEGVFSREVWKTSATRFSLSTGHFETKSEEHMLQVNRIHLVRNNIKDTVLARENGNIVANENQQHI